MILFVNAYVITRHYGGPEGGGWWWNSGEPTASVPVKVEPRAVPCACVGWEGFDSSTCSRCDGKRTKEMRRRDYPEVQSTIASLRELFADENEGGIYSVLGGQEVSVSVEEHTARVWPETRPHYE